MSWQVKDGKLVADGPMAGLMRDLMHAYEKLPEALSTGLTEQVWLAGFADRGRAFALEMWEDGGILARRRARRLEALELEIDTTTEQIIVHMPSVWPVLDFLAANLNGTQRRRIIAEQARDLRDALLESERAAQRAEEDLAVVRCDRGLSGGRTWIGWGVSINGAAPVLQRPDAQNVWVLTVRPANLPPGAVQDLAPGQQLAIRRDDNDARWTIATPDGQFLLELPQGPSAFADQARERGEQVGAVVLGQVRLGTTIEEVRLLFFIHGVVRFED